MAVRWTRTPRAARSACAAAPALFAATFAAQATMFVLPLVLPAVAERFGVSIGMAGQLRAISGVGALLAPAGVVVLARSLDTRSLILLGLLLDTVGSIAALSAWSFGALVLAHALIGVGLGTVLSSCLTASAEWAPESGRVRLLSWTTMGMGAAAVVVTPLAGLLAMLGWRLVWLLPTAAGLLALRMISARPAVGSAAAGRMAWSGTLRLPGVASWCIGEFLAYAGWSVVTVYSAALFMQSYGTTPLTAGVIISMSASAFLLGTRLVRSRLCAPRTPLLVLALAMAACGAALGLVRISLPLSALLLVLLGLLNGGRNPAGSALGLALAPRHRLQLMAARTSAQSLGHLAGASCGGLVLAGHDFSGLGALMGLLFGMAALPHAAALVTYPSHQGSALVQLPDRRHAGAFTKEE